MQWVNWKGTTRLSRIPHPWYGRRWHSFLSFLATKAMVCVGECFVQINFTDQNERSSHILTF